MPPITGPKIKIKIRSRFTDELGGQLYGPGEWDVAPVVAHRLVANGRATLVPGPGEKPQVKTAPLSGLQGGTPATNPRIPPVKEPEAPTATTLPENFPSRKVLAEAGFDTFESLQGPDIKEELGKVQGLTPAAITKIGLAVSKA